MSNSRYREQPKSLDRVVAELIQRVGRLERLPRAGSTAVDKRNFEIKEGALRVYDNSGTLVVEVGLMDDGRYGVRVNDTSGEVVMLTQTGIEAQNNTGTIVPLNIP